MMDTNFLVCGTAIHSSRQVACKLSTRKFYSNNTNYRLSAEANHYRDSKIKIRTQPRQTKVFSYYYKKKVDVPMEFCDYKCQPELLMAIHTFPSFQKVYTPCGRKTLCNQRKADLIYNDTIRRIQRSIGNAKVLKNLAKKHIEKFELRYQNKKRSNNLNINKRRRSLRKLKSVEHLKQQRQKLPPLSINTQHLDSVSSWGCESSDEYVGAKTLKYYLQLATAYYQQGFLQKIKYLENVGTRNQLRREQQQRNQNVQTTLKESLRNITNIVTRTSTSLEIELGTVNNSGIREKKINQHNPIVFQQQQQQNEKLTANDFVFNNNNIKDCAIWVDVKPQTTSTNHRENCCSENKTIYRKKEIVLQTKDLINSMNDYLDCNFEYNQLQESQRLQQQQIFQNTSTNNQNDPAKALLIDTVIDNLRELDIQENRANLPRITLTDFTNKYPNELNSNYQI